MYDSLVKYSGELLFNESKYSVDISSNTVRKTNYLSILDEIIYLLLYHDK